MSQYIWGQGETQYFYQLTPDTILDTASNHNFEVTGRCLTLNSMENRVYEVEIYNADSFPSLTNSSIIAKFYRPGRWSKEQILEEHRFLLELEEAEVPVIAPLLIDGDTLFYSKEHQLFYTFFPKKGGRAPDELNEEGLQILGRMLARLHNVGSLSKAPSRITISPESFGRQNLNFLLSQKVIPSHIESSYQRLVEEICLLIEPLFQNISIQRIHGDCHIGNIISRDQEGMFFIDFDDMLMGPAIQDIWLVTPGTDSHSLQDRAILLEAYQEMRSFNYQELKLVEPLRTLRFIHFSAWIAKRWQDPAFKVAFAHFEDHQYWDVQLNDLRRQKLLIENSLSESLY